MFKERMMTILVTLAVLTSMTLIALFIYWMESVFHWIEITTDYILAMPTHQAKILFFVLLSIIILYFLWWLIIQPFLHWRKHK